MASQWTLTFEEGRIIEEYRRLDRSANEGRLEILLGVEQGRRKVELRPTSFLKLKRPEPLHPALET